MSAKAPMSKEGEEATRRQNEAFARLQAIHLAYINRPIWKRAFSACSKVLLSTLQRIGVASWRVTFGYFIFVKQVYYPFDVNAEAGAMMFIRQHTSIPVPRVLLHFTFRRCGYIFMMRATGQDLGHSKVWDTLDSNQRKNLQSQLREIVTELRSLPPLKHRMTHPETISSVYGGPVGEPLVCDNGQVGPFKGHEDFLRWMRYGYTVDELQTFPDISSSPVILEGLTALSNRHYDIVFTHGDLAGRNIMVTSDGVITAILDWETSGWYPEYWESFKAHANIFSMCVHPLDRLHAESIPCYPLEARSLMVLQDLKGVPWLRDTTT